MNFREVLFIVLGKCADDLVCMYIFVQVLFVWYFRMYLKADYLVYH